MIVLGRTTGIMTGIQDTTIRTIVHVTGHITRTIMVTVTTRIIPTTIIRTARIIATSVSPKAEVSLLCQQEGYSMRSKDPS